MKKGSYTFIIGTLALVIITGIIFTNVPTQPLSETGIFSSTIAQSKKDFFKAYLVYDKTTSDAIKDCLEDSLCGELGIETKINEYYSNTETNLHTQGVYCSSKETPTILNKSNKIEIKFVLVCETKIGTNLSSKYWKTVKFTKTYSTKPKTTNTGNSITKTKNEIQSQIKEKIGNASNGMLKTG